MTRAASTCAFATKMTIDVPREGESVQVMTYWTKLLGDGFTK